MKVVKSLLKSFCYVGLFLGMQLLVSFAAEFLYGFKVGIECGLSGQPIDQVALVQGLQEFLVKNMNLLILISGALTILFLVVFFICRKKSILKEIQMNKLDKKMVLPLIVMGCSFSVLVSGILCVLPLPEDLAMSYAEAAQGLVAGSLIIRILGVVLFTPIVEEIVFRGLIFSRLKQGMKTSVAIVVSSLIFGLMHGHIIWVAYTFIAGILFAVVMEKTNSLKASILLHMAFNSVSAIIGAINLSGIVAYIAILIALVLVVGSLVFVLKNNDSEELGDFTCEIA